MFYGNGGVEVFAEPVGYFLNQPVLYRRGLQRKPYQYNQCD